VATIIIRFLVGFMTDRGQVYKILSQDTGTQFNTHVSSIYLPYDQTQVIWSLKQHVCAIFSSNLKNIKHKCKHLKNFIQHFPSHRLVYWCAPPIFIFFEKIFKHFNMSVLVKKPFKLGCLRRRWKTGIMHISQKNHELFFIRSQRNFHDFNDMFASSAVDGRFEARLGQTHI
jgi:hypothetical protein